jgi:hypothetical protein
LFNINKYIVAYIPNKGNWVEWNLTYRCDLRCVGCNRLPSFQDSTPDMTLEDADEFCRQATELDWHPGICIIGGEPTLHPDFLTFVDRAKNFTGIGRLVQIWSNAYRPGARDLLADAKKKYRLLTINKNTHKPQGSIVQPSLNLFLAPCDFGLRHGPCGWHSSQVRCGISVDHGGYTICSMGGAIDSILNLGLRTKRLADLFDEEWAKKQTEALCRVCGHDMEYDAGLLTECRKINGVMMSKTWEQAVSKLV